MSAEQLSDLSEANTPAQPTRNWVEHFNHLDPDNEGMLLSRKQEAVLAEYIQEGIALAAATEAPTAQQAEIIARGQEARQALFEVNMPFALYCARESVGITHPNSQAKLARVGFRRISGRASGTHRPLISNKSPYANLEDRQQSALEGLWTATGAFKPTAHTSSRGSARFISYAAYPIQQYIERNIELEEKGIRLKSAQPKVATYFAGNPGGNRDDMPDEIRRLVELGDYHDYDALAPVKSHSLDEDYIDDDTVTSLEDIWADTREMNDVTSAVEHNAMRDQLEDLLDSLSEREAGVIRMRYGLHDKGVHTLDEIGDTFGVTRERIRQIEKKAMAKLRHPSRTKSLVDFLEPSIEHSHLYTGDSIVARLPQLEYPQPIHQHEQNAFVSKNHLKSSDQLEAWQLTKDEAWGDPVRFERSRLMDDDSFAKVATVVTGAANWHFDKRSSTKNERMYSKALKKRIDDLGGEGRMSVAQIEHLWDTFMADTYPRLQEELDDQLSNDQIGRFFSSILAQHIDTSEMADRKVTLRIPEYASGKINYLASNLRQGVIEIAGNAGAMTGAYNKGAVNVIVVGDTGKSTGAYSRDYATVVVKGTAGYNTGYNMREHASVVARDVKQGSTEREETTRIIRTSDI